MSVELNPQELGFKRPFDHEITETLKLTNTNSTPIAFKVKTTAPKQYCVRPNSGVIQPDSNVEVQVLLQAMKEEPPLDFKCRDKFLVQSVPVPSDTTDSSNITSLWSNIEKTAKGSIQERKIRVTFLSPGSTAATNGVNSHDEEPPSYTSSTPQFGSPAQASSGTPNQRSVADTARSAAEATGITTAAAAVSNAIPTNTEQLKSSLATGNAKAQQLASQVQDPEFRQRKVTEAQEKVQAVVQQSQNSGVPLHIVAVLCLLSFIIAYLFF